MKYKGIIFDVDGTAVPLGAMSASKELRAAIQDNKDKIHLVAATGRGPDFSKPILTSLGLSEPCIIMGGTAIVDPKSFDVLWQKKMTADQVAAVSELLQGFKAKVYAFEDPTSPTKEVQGTLPATALSVIYSLAMQPQKALDLIEELQALDGIAGHSTPSWDKGLVDVHITHAEATKEHAIHQLKEMLGLTSDELVGVGDSANDMPIFKAVGHKVAIGSGSPELIALADEVAPALDQNGLATIIAKYA